jgi:hypothetical protein
MKAVEQQFLKQRLVMGREMIKLVEFEPWWRRGVAVIFGALLGMERDVTAD